ncbi:hypothetical protein DFQ01_14022 [Paenibacillus cellulosilyticus]|uniref:Aldolase n=1 Tax=Paenibacillus cellulosilyticus TaxID=375489 RepID=A0A2V2YEM1_9BACL|nr:aldolase [Paenibacillus cellulosilyticus]PWV90639.1 hypothetical protein DFQ01_14022 [Paenibacillus cellulosilyticus]QKS43939.1 aldolase [Paenibacillus cellulosilyticus]
MGSREEGTMYDAFGMRIACCIEMPELFACEAPVGEQPDVDVVIGDLTDAWSRYGQQGGYYGFGEGLFLLYVPGAAIFEVRDGRRITISPFPEADDRTIRLYLLGTCMGMILIQRRTIPLHGSAIVMDGQAYAFVGESGAGKSTLAAALINSGFQLMTDDVIAVSLDSSGGGALPIVHSAYPQQKLWQNSLEKLEMEAGHYRTIYSNKFAVPVADRFYVGTLPLAGIFELGPTDKSEVDFKPCVGLDKLRILHQHTFRRFLIDYIGEQQWHFRTLSAIADRVPVYQLYRPAEGFTVSHLMTRVLDTVRGVVTS